MNVATAPLIVTLTLDAAAQAAFDALRRAYFPPDRLHVGAHVTLFHALPSEHETEVTRAVAAACAATPPFAVTVKGLRLLGRGVAFALRSDQASALREGLRAAFADQLAPQDRAPWLPHVTVQNKVAPEVARRTLIELERCPALGPVAGTGLALWRYLGGPWQAAGAWEFARIAIGSAPPAD